MKKVLLNLVLGASLGFASTIMAADGKALYTQKLCQTCHGSEGSNPIAPMYPKLNGQNSTYLLNQIKDIKSGKRNNGLSMIMKPMVAALSEADMEAIADYLSKVK
ncbi:MAG: cytochrome c [Cycloclasticus sp.]